MTKTLALMTLCLLILTSACTSEPPCPKRPRYTGVTYGDEVTYCRSLEVLYDSCSGKVK